MAHTFASASASASTSASASASAHMYDVFLNHRGPDVKITLASHIYYRLLPYGLHVFLDQQELQPGEALTPQIEGAIASSSVQVAIFSTRYAESNWCLDELVRMLLESKRSGATIIPVFFNVQPSDLRWPDKGRYAQSLLTHESNGRYNKETLADWRAALVEVSHISGFELKSCNGDEGELVNKVVQQVMKKVKKPPLHVAVHPTGLDNKLNDFETKVLVQQQHSGQGKVVGIVGLGGVGKTTMAKEFFNRKRSNYDRSCFLAEVREAAARSSLTSLQSKLYKDLTGSAEVMDSVDEGTGMLRRAFSCSQVLIILDDIDHVEQLLAFFSPRDDVLHPGSLIIVTSRNLEVLKVLGIEVSSIYNMTGLDEEHSQLLFCLHAFDQPFPVVEFEELVGKFLKLCAGLPLSLKVLGRLLHGKKDLGYWEGQLKKIFKSGLPTDIQSRLRISYDSLDEEEKNIFLDIACFFIGTEKDTAIRIWDGSGWAGSVGFLNLEYKCLVEIDNENCIRMHDQLRDLGRYLAEKEPLGSGLRLWRPTYSLFRNVPPQSTVRGIKIDFGSRIGEECSNHIVDMRGLQLLSAPHAFLESISEVLRKADLVWLSIHSISPMPCLPSWIPTRNLRVLELKGLDGYNFLEEERFRRGLQRFRRGLQRFRCGLQSEVPPETLWETENAPEPRVQTLWETERCVETLWETENEVPLELKELRVPSKLLRLPRSIGQLKHLEMIELHDFRGSSLPEEFFHLHSLKHLKLTLTASEMKSLPDSLGKLTNLQHIDLSHCCYLQTLPVSFGNLTKLQHVNLSWCYKIEVLPLQVTYQRSLVELILGCGQLKALPSAIGDLCNLKILELKCPLLEILPPSLCNLTNLERFDIECSRLKCLPDSIGELKQLISLSIVNTGIEYFPALPTTLRELNNLEVLTVGECPIREVPFASVEKAHKCMVRLKRLELRKTRITEISFGEGVCPNLQELILHSCDELVEIGALPTTLTSLEMRYCRALNRIRGISGIECLPVGARELNNLEVLTVKDCPIREVSFASVEKVRKCMVRLKTLELRHTRITEISFGEGVCPNLQELILHSCHELVEIGALPTTLSSLEMRYCSALNRIRGISGLRKLLELGRRDCKEVEARPALEMLISLQWVGISKCDKMTNIAWLSEAVNPESDIFKKLNLKLIKVVEEIDVMRPEDYFLESEEEDYFQESEAEDLYFQESGAEKN